VLLSIRKIFFHFKFALAVITGGMMILAVQLFHVASYADRLSALKNQHALIDKVIKADLNDISMANIVIHGALSELTLSVKRSGEEELLDSFVSSNDEQASLLRSLTLSSDIFQKTMMTWIVTPELKRQQAYQDVLSARTALLTDIDHMIDYQIQCTAQSVASAKMTGLILLIIVAISFFFFRSRLNLIYSDIDTLCSVDVDGKRITHTEEANFIVKHFGRKSMQNGVNSALLHPLSGLYNDKGLMSSFSMKKSAKSGNNLFLALFKVDDYDTLRQGLSSEELGNVYRKLGEMLSMYEQSHDILAHLEDDTLVFLLSRGSKESALDECNRFIEAVRLSSFATAQGVIKISLSGGFILKAPIKTLEESIDDVRKILAKAIEKGGNQVSQIRD
jgi:GGDEF domain-containing protein